MAADKKFTPRASTNLIKGEVVETTPNEEAVADTTPNTDVPAPVEDKTNTDAITFTAQTNKTPIEKMVKIRLAKKYDGCIGGVWYHFAKDQVVTVPENVKRILNRAEGMLKPL